MWLSMSAPILAIIPTFGSKSQKVYAFEPEENNLKILRKNLGVNEIKMLK